MTDRQVKELINKFHVPRHILAHMRKVAAISMYLADNIGKNHMKVDKKSLYRAAMLHDLVKIADFKINKLKYIKQNINDGDIKFWKTIIGKYGNLGHIEAAAKILTKLGQKKIAQIIRKHRFNSPIDPNPKKRPETIEEKILYYADKRVMHDKIVSIERRLIDGRQRYLTDGKVHADDIRVKKALKILEKELCEKAGIGKKDINEKNMLIYLRD